MVNPEPPLSGDDPGDSDPADLAYYGGPLVIERIAPALAAMRKSAEIEGFRAESPVGPEWEQDTSNVTKASADASFDGAWLGLDAAGVVIYCGGFSSLMALVPRYGIDQVRSPEGIVYRRRATPDMMTALRDIARGGR